MHTGALWPEGGTDGAPNASVQQESGHFKPGGVRPVANMIAQLIWPDREPPVGDCRFGGMANPRTLRRLAWFGVPIVLLGILVAVWNWDWFIPIVQSRASAAIGRPVTIGHLHVRFDPFIQVVADDIVVANPPDWPDKGDPPLASIKSLTIQADVFRYLHGGGLVVPLVAIDTPKLFVAETKDGEANFRLATSSGGSKSSSNVKIGNLRISDGTVHAVVPKLKSNFTVQVDTRGEGRDAKLVAEAKGTYANQPITGTMVGGALLSLRDKSNPWPIDLKMANGPTHVEVKGTVEEPVAFKGADVRVRFYGPDMGLLEPLAGIPIPATPPYDMTGKVDLEGWDTIRLNDFRGRVGNSDMHGTIVMKPGAKEENGKYKPEVTMDLRSNRVDLTDFAGFLGATPHDTAHATPEQRREIAKANASPRLLPDKRISVPRLKWADIHVKFHGDHIVGRSMPLDDVTVVADVVNGAINVHPASFGVGKGRLITDLDLVPVSDRNVHARADIRMQNLSVSRLMQATHTFQGAGTISGVGAIDGTGDSVASLLGNGNGEMKMAMAGGDLSALLVDLTGLEFGKALLSALGMPQKTAVQCFVSDLLLKRGILDFRVMTLDTGEAITNVGGDVNLRDEAIDLSFKTDSKHFSIGSLPTRIHIGGTFKDPSIRPGAEVAARAGAAAGLAVLFAPLAILPTIQFGTSAAQDARCGELLHQARESAGGKALPKPRPSATSER
ncbi:hypothetical protein CCS01_30835 [Rhodopila globiformis]|uniref:AsmA domain-containing protein n=2 Tax=Rhodopila globiformis TaxID=1071 RepID=A0A2S6MV46_RHOGL|nr:hypothetical protein CCS01_30835 [Rhodopila globiformis]